METPPPTPAPTTTVTYEDFAKLEFRVATVLECKPHPNADKLLVLQIDLGGERRQICAGLRQHVADPQSLVGRQARGGGEFGAAAASGGNQPGDAAGGDGYGDGQSDFYYAVGSLLSGGEGELKGVASCELRVASCELRVACCELRVKSKTRNSQLHSLHS